MPKFHLFKTFLTVLVFFLTCANAWAQGESEDLAAQARDPTAPLTAFSIRYDFTTSFHHLPGAQQQQLTLQPVIPFKIGNQQNIARITVPYVTNGPDWGLVAGKVVQGLPPYYVPTANKTGLGDINLVDVLIFPTSFGRQGFGASLVLPTASDPALGSEKWSIGPSYALMTKLGGFQGGFLAQWLFSVAGNSNRDDISAIVLQPFGGVGFSGGWSLNMSEMVFNYNVKAHKWASLPLGLSVEKLIHIGDMPARLFVQYEHNFQKSGIAPANIVRFGFVPLF